MVCDEKKVRNVLDKFKGANDFQGESTMKTTHFLKYFVAIICLAASTHINAGFIAGMIVGSSTNGPSPAKGAAAPVAVFSDSADVISCRLFDPGVCKPETINSRPISFLDFARRSGYSRISKIGVVIGPDGGQYVIMEVQK